MPSAASRDSEIDLQRLKELLAQAEALPAAEREPFLESAAGDSPALAGELRSLLAASDDTDDPFRKSPALAPDPSSAFPKRIGPYDIDGVLGRGGMGIVYRAINPQAGVPVALKVIQPGMGTGEFLKRFEAERKVLGRFQHRNIAQIFDAGIDPAGPPFLVMELVDGPNLLDYCDARQATLAERLQLFREVCLGVYHAHLRGVLHRDLKPSNVLVAIEDGRPVPKIIDFGIAKATGQGEGMTEIALTLHGQMVGTLEYMSPEQAEASIQDIDTRSDVYSLGVMLYELVTCKLPFKAERYRAGSHTALLRMLREETPITPSDRVEELWGNEAIPSDLDCLILKCLQADRALRYTSAKELADDLERFLTGHAVSAKAPSRGYLARKFVQRHKLAVGAAAAVLLTLVLGLAGTSYGFYRELLREQELKRKVASLEQALEDSESISIYLYRLMRMSLPEHLGPSGSIRQAVYELVELAQTDAESADFARGRVLIHAGRVLADIDDDEAAMDALTEGVALVGMPTTERGRFMRSLALYDIGYMHYERRRLDEAEQAFLAARESLVGLESSHLSMVIAVESSLAGVIEDRGQYVRALELLSTIVERGEQAGLPPARLGSHTVGLGLAMFRVGDREAGLETMRRGYAMSIADREPHEAIPLSCQRALGVMLLEAFRFEEAVEVFEDYVRNVAAGPGAETFDGRSARVLLRLARSHVEGAGGPERAPAAELEGLREEFPERLRDSVLPQHLLAADLIHGRQGAVERATAFLAELDAAGGAGHAAIVAQLFGRAALRGDAVALRGDAAALRGDASEASGAHEAAKTFLVDALNRHRLLMAGEAPLLAELEALIERAERRERPVEVALP
ncbi:MAG: serine/threonine-protein kinase [Acidobacteriota bacterium]